jgi:diketogulonate reductase-like aldo/keto reductase
MHMIEANGAKIPALGFGTWTLRGRECAEMVREALAVGYRHIDTAHMYDNETEVGEGLRGSGVPRGDVFVTTKVWHTDLAPADLERSAEASVKRLGLDQVDLLVIHWPNPRLPLEPTIRALNRVRERGLTRHIGVSNFPVSMLEQAIGFSAAPLVCNQVEYHPYLSQAKVLKACRDNGLALVAYCPLYRGGGLIEEKVIVEAAKRHGKTPGQVVLRWHVQQKGVVAIPRTTKKERVTENFAIFDFKLSDAEMTSISALQKANSRIVDYDFSPLPGWDVG